MNKKLLIILLIILLFWYYKRQKANGAVSGSSGAGIFAGLEGIWNWNNNFETDPLTGEPIPEEEKETKWQLEDPLKPEDIGPVKPYEDLSKDVVSPVKPPDSPPPPKPSASRINYSGKVNWKAR